MTLFVNEDDRFGGNRPPQRGGKTSSLWKYGVFLVLIVGISLGAWYVFRSFRSTSHPEDLPLIRADEQPYKIKSQDMSVPGVEHQDKLIYHRLRKEEGPPPVEHILPDSESIKMIEQYIPRDINPEETPPLSIGDLLIDTEDSEGNQ